MKAAWLGLRKDDIRSAVLESESTKSEALEKEGSITFEVFLESTGIGLGRDLSVFGARH